MASYQLHMEETFEVKRSKEDCFRYITDFSIIKEWDHTAVDSSKKSDGLIGKGTQFEVVLKMGLSKTKMDYEITEYQYPNHAILVGEASSFKAIDTVELSSINEHTTKVTWKADITFHGITGKVISMVESSVKKSGAKTIEGLKKALEDNYSVHPYKSSLKIADAMVFPGLFLFTKYGYQLAQKRWNPISASIVDKHILLTGATSGLGLATAEALAHRGAKLTLVARNKAKADRVVKELVAKTGNTNISIELADMSLMSEVNALSERLLSKGATIDVLINNAGALFNDRIVTTEGLEKSFALLLLAPFTLTEKLIPLLSASKDGRVINVSSGGMYSEKISVKDLEFKSGKYNGSAAYARAKRGLMVITEQWAERFKDTNITFNAMHPGWADTPGVLDALPGFYKVTKNVLRTSREGADTIVWLAAASEANQLNGQFLLDRVPHKTHLLPNTKASKADRAQLSTQLENYVERYTATIKAN